jgi:uracil-DNA glycosylase family 4
MALPSDPPRDCPRCVRLCAFRAKNRATHADWFNGAVPSFGDPDATLVVVGLAPGLRGANRTGRPFTGDFAGDLLYATLLKQGLAHGSYARDGAGDDLALVGTLITNAVRCVPPENKPLPAEIAACNEFLAAAFEALPRSRVFLALGRIAHDAALRALRQKPGGYAFAHGAAHALPSGLTLVDSFHCSRLNTNTGRLTAAMFEEVVAHAKALASLV